MAEVPHIIDDSRITRGKIFRTAFPFLEPRPLAFFEHCEKYAQCEHCNSGQDYCGRVITKPYGFESNNDDELYVVTRFKARYSIVLSTQALNTNTRWFNIIVAPLVGIHDDELHKTRIKKIMNREESYFTAYYLEPKITGMHCYIDLGRIGPIHKSWLLQERNQLTDEKDFVGISERIGIIMAQRSLIDCRNCKKPCEECTIKEELALLREELKQLGA